MRDYTTIRGERVAGEGWTVEDQNAAFRQGWGIFETSFLVEEVACIQRVDDPASLDLDGFAQDVARFPDDYAAKAYVVGRAEMGCILAQKALRCIDTAYRVIGHPEEFNYLIA